METGGPVVRMGREQQDVMTEVCCPCIYWVICLSGFLLALKHEPKVT